MGITFGSGLVFIKPLDDEGADFAPIGRDCITELTFADEELPPVNMFPIISNIGEPATLTCKTKINVRALFCSRVCGRQWRNRFKALRMMIRRAKV